jgi:hypothetical protein
VPELAFKVESARESSINDSALALRLEIINSFADERVHSIALTVQLQIEPARRRYSDAEKEALSDLFGEPVRWGTTVRPLFWSTVNAVVPGFIGETFFDLELPCALDAEISVAKYLRALDTGEVPVALLFSGRVMYVNDDSVQMAPIPWSQETSCRVPVQLVKKILAAAPRASAERGVAWT